MKEVKAIKLSTGKKMIPGGFRKAYDNMPHGNIEQVREDIMHLCYWSLSTFKSKINGFRPFRAYEVEQLNQYFAEKGINAWTGLPIK
jgi:hypothetical protein